MTVTESVLGFALASLAITLVPGPSWMYVISTSITGSRTAGFVAVAGNGSGILCHVAAASLGVSLFVVRHAVVFETIRWAGVTYLLFLGWRTLFQQPREGHLVTGSSAGSTAAIFVDGMLVNLFNPKVFVLMLALLPQFVELEQASFPRTACIGSIHAVVASSVLSCLVLISSKARSTVQVTANRQRMFRFVAGSILIGFGIQLAVAGIPGR